MLGVNHVLLLLLLVKNRVSMKVILYLIILSTGVLLVHSNADFAREDPDNRQSTVLRQNTGNWHSQLKFHGFVPCSVT
ncbi:hypothetical protein ACLB2K_020767 [Fragaria x ananassa]